MVSDIATSSDQDDILGKRAVHTCNESILQQNFHPFQPNNKNNEKRLLHSNRIESTLLTPVDNQGLDPD